MFWRLIESECKWNCNVSSIIMKTKEKKSEHRFCWIIVKDYLKLFLLKRFKLKTNDAKKCHIYFSSFAIEKKRTRQTLYFYFIWLEQIENIYVDIFVCIDIPWGHCRCDMLIVCIQKKFNWKIFVLFWTACNVIMLHVFFYCLTNGNQWTYAFRFYTDIDMMVDWLYSIRK